MSVRAMILAAGLGTRLRPLTDTLPKALIKINQRSLLERNIRYLQGFGIFEVIVNVHHFAEQIIQEITENKGWGSRIAISDEREQLLETGGGIRKASWFLEQGPDFLLINADILTNLDLGLFIAAHRETGALASLATSDRKSSRYLLFNQEAQLSGWRNVSTGEEKIVRQSGKLVPKAFSGIHLISSKIFPLIRLNGKFSMIDLYLDLAADYTIKAFDHSGSKFIDVGKPDSIQTAEELFRDQG